MEKWFISMTGYMKGTSKAPDSCGGWAHILWNVAGKTGEQGPQISHMWDTWEVYIYIVGSDDLRKENFN